jgi:hypothetical protein
MERVNQLTSALLCELCMNGLKRLEQVLAPVAADSPHTARVASIGDTREARRAGTNTAACPSASSATMPDNT